MAYNLFIACDLVHPGDNYDAVCQRIRALGDSYQYQLSLFYVHTECNPSEAFNRIAPAMDVNDRLLVINAGGGVVTDWGRPPIDAVKAIWMLASQPSVVRPTA